MTRLEAVEALLQGKKIRHNYYSDNEWLTLKGTQLVTEEGYPHGTFRDEFWTQYQKWEDGWSIVEEVDDNVQLPSDTYNGTDIENV